MIVSTYFLVTTGVDWWYFEHTRIFFSLALPAAILGFFVPILTPVILYLWGEATQSATLQRNAALVAQAGLLGIFTSSLYKAFTGRPGPEFLTNLINVDISHVFNFGILKHGVFWGWPSSHTAVAFAMSTAIILLYPKNKVLSLLIGAYALYIGLGVSISIHWFSDFIAGALLGILVGGVVATKTKRA